MRTSGRSTPPSWRAVAVALGLALVALPPGARLHGSDSLLDPADEPTKDASRQGGKRLATSLTLALHPASRMFKNQQFVVQGDMPAVQSLDGRT